MTTSTARLTPSSARIFAPRTAARVRIPSSVTARVIAAANRSAVSRLRGIGAGPAPSAATRRPRTIDPRRRARRRTALPRAALATSSPRRRGGPPPPCAGITTGTAQRPAEILSAVGRLRRVRPSPQGSPRAARPATARRRPGAQSARPLAAHAPEPDVDRGRPGFEEFPERRGRRPLARAVEEPVPRHVDVCAPIRCGRDDRRAEAVQYRLALEARGVEWPAQARGGNPSTSRRAILSAPRTGCHITWRAIT